MTRFAKFFPSFIVPISILSKRRTSTFLIKIPNDKNEDIFSTAGNNNIKKENKI